MPDGSCPRCNGRMLPGKALLTETCCVSGLRSPTRMVECMKCEDCGHSETVEER